MNRPQIRPYRAVASSRTKSEILDQCNQALFDNYSAESTANLRHPKPVTNPLSAYKLLLERLKEIPGVEFRTMDQAISLERNPDAVTIAIRHDVDGDIVVTKMMAEIENQLGISTTYYILHTAFYYGHFDGTSGCFHRHDSMGDVYREIQGLGHEIGLHTDPLHIYQDLQIDGAEAVVQELDWLRGQGLRVVGTAAHNHVSVYGAQNYEIFKERPRYFARAGGSAMAPVDESEVFFNGKWAPLHILDEKELGLCYEGDDAYRLPGYLGIISETAFNTFYRTWNNFEVDLVARGLKIGPADFYQLMESLKNLQEGDLVLFTTHPLYYGRRNSPNSAPSLDIEPLKICENESFGGPTYQTESLVEVPQAAAVPNPNSKHLVFTNGYGQISRPFRSDSRALTVLIFGGRHINASHLDIPYQIECILERKLEAFFEKEIQVRTFALPRMAISRIASWYENLQGDTQASVVLLSIDRGAMANCLPHLWNKGADRDGVQLPEQGEYLAWDFETETVELRDCSGQNFEGEQKTLCPSDLDLAELTDETRVQGIPCLQYLKECYRHLAERIRKNGGIPYLFVEETSWSDTEPEYIVDTKKRKAAFNARISEIADTADIEIVDPTDALVECSSRNRVFDEQSRWTSKAHDVVGGLISKALSRLLPPGGMQSSRLKVSGAAASDITDSDSVPSYFWPKSIKAVNIHSLSYTGTTWLNVLLGCHHRAFAIGPPDRFLELFKSSPEKLCLIHHEDCAFWPKFCAGYDPEENFFIQFYRFTGKDTVILNNPRPDGFAEYFESPAVNVKTILFVRDGRAVGASYARKMNVSFQDSIKNWYYPAIRGFPVEADSTDSLFLRYEDLVETPGKILEKLSAFVWLPYSEDCLRYWAYEHHPISGNQGMYAMMKLHLNLPIADFESREFYEREYHKGNETKGFPIQDLRWKEQLTRKDRFAYDYLCGQHHAKMGYERDELTPEEMDQWLPEMLQQLGPSEVPEYRTENLAADLVGLARSLKSRLGRLIGLLFTFKRI